jgi:hypothetical protein
LLDFHLTQHFLQQTMHLASVINELTFVIETFISEAGDFFRSWANVKNNGRRDISVGNLKLG